jgi:hypothetical protein
MSKTPTLAFVAAAILISTPSLGQEPRGGADKPGPRPAEQPRSTPSPPAPTSVTGATQQNSVSRDVYYGFTTNDPFGFATFGLNGDPKQSLGLSVFKPSFASLKIGLGPTLTFGSDGSAAAGVTAGASVLGSVDLVIFFLPPRKAGDIQINFRAISTGGYLGIHSGIGEQVSDFAETVGRLNGDPAFATALAEGLSYSMGLVDLSGSFSP